MQKALYGCVALAAAVLFVQPVAAADEDTFVIINKSYTEVNARVRMYTDDYTRISVDNEAEMKLPVGRGSASVEMKTRKQWDGCYVYAFPGAKVVVTQDGAQIKCRVTR